MDRRLRVLIGEYQAAVERALELLEESGLLRPRSALEWAMSGYPGVGVLRNGTRYRKHGYGCEVDLPTGPVDFDFGPNGETSGFDAWRLVAFAGAHLASYGFESPQELESVLEAAESRCELRRSRSMLFLATCTS